VPFAETVTVPALATFGSGQMVDFYNGSNGPINLAINTYGLEDTASSTTAVFGDICTPVGPARMLAATKVPGGGHVTFSAAGTGGVPAGANAVVLDVTASGATGPGYMTAYPDKAANPGIHDADWAGGQMATGLAVVPLLDGKAVLHNSGKGSAVFTADVVGYYEQYGTGSVFLPSAPSRLLDVKLGPDSSTALQIAGKNGRPGGGISAAAVNLTVSGGTRSGTVGGWADKTATLIVDLTGGYYRYPAAP
jgi:hypothetical protein